MPNSIKYNVSTETLALKKGNFWIGTGDVGKGPTNVTGYYNGITPPVGGFTIYLNKATSGPSIYTVSTEAQLVSLTNTIGAQSFTTSGQCLNWFATQTDKMIFNIDYPAIVTDGLVLNLDAGFAPSYPTTGTTWYDVSSGGNNGTLVNGVGYNSGNLGSLVFDGVDDKITTNQLSGRNPATNPFTIEAWVKSDVTGVAKMWIDATRNGTNQRFYATLINGGTSNIGIQGSAWSNSSPNDTEWHYQAIVMDSSTARGYDNGFEVQTKPYTSYTLAGPLNIGGRGGYRWSGLIANFKIYNRALTADEVLQNYNATKTRFGL